VQYEVNFGRLGKATRATPGPVFRVAVLGDFSGRASAGVLETGPSLVSRRPHKADVDTLDALIAKLLPDLTIALDGAENAVSVPLSSIDDFHPDQLVENLPIFSELLSLRRALQSRAGFERAAKQVLSWAGETPLPVVSSRRPRGTAVATDRKLSDFTRLVGRPALEEAPASELIRRLVGPYVVPERDPRQEALVACVDGALSETMRRVLHHPDFQTAESLWRGVDFLVRRIETGARLQIVLYDVSAEELAADLAASDSLEKSGLYGMLVEQPALDAHQGPLSMIAGLFQFEATPPHADLLGRLAQIAAVAGAPFIAGIAPDQLKVPLHEWHPLTRQAWQALRELAASVYLGLSSPRFLLRMPYGKRTDPIDAFAFEEFTRESGLSGMLWGHPALLACCLVAETWRQNSKAMKLGSVATVGDLPVYVYHDMNGEQIALPCTERLFTERQAVEIAGCGVIPVISLRGRPEVRVAGFTSMTGNPLAGHWGPVDITPPPPPARPAPATAQTGKPAPQSAPAATPAVAAKPAPAAATAKASPPAPTEPAAEEAAAAKPTPPPAPPATELAPAPDANELDSLMASLDAPTTPAAADDLDSLLASLNAEPSSPMAGETEPDLDALLASLK
jgi:type VI secretion system ImpB/VipA family protein